MLFCCRKKFKEEEPSVDVNSLLSVAAITLQDIRSQQDELLRQVSAENFKDELYRIIHNKVEIILQEAVSQKVKTLKHQIITQIENGVTDAEFKIVSKVSLQVEKKVEKIIKEYLMTAIPPPPIIITPPPIATPPPTPSKPSLPSDISENNKRYMQRFNTDDTIFWGIGIENETYIQFDDVIISGDRIPLQLGRERYSVDYTKNYNIKEIQEHMKRELSGNNYRVGRMANAHSLNKIDRHGEHRTLYAKDPKPNPKFSGKSILEEWFEYDPEIREKVHPTNKTLTNIFFDGDTIEFITEDFYKTDTLKVSKELIRNREWFLERFKRFRTDTKLWPDIGEPRFVVEHPGLNTFLSQPEKIVLFNNTTIHVHITLPTPICNGVITSPKEFEKNHRIAMKMLQWFEPFFIATLGAPDPFNNFEKAFAGGSMRATLSRYIGIGTYNTDRMEEKKILQKPITEVRPTGVWWRDLVEKEMKYNLPSDEIGLDFNYAKYYQSGIEFRILDGFPMEILQDVLNVILLICEHSLHFEDLPHASTSDVWNHITYRTMRDGYASMISQEEMLFLAQVLRIPIIIEREKSLEEFYYSLLESMYNMYPVSTSRVLHQMTRDFSCVRRWENFNHRQTRPITLE